MIKWNELKNNSKCVMIRIVLTQTELNTLGDFIEAYVRIRVVLKLVKWTTESNDEPNKDSLLRKGAAYFQKP